MNRNKIKFDNLNPNNLLKYIIDLLKKIFFSDVIKR